MDIATAALLFTMKLMDATHNPNWGPYDTQTMSTVVKGIVGATNDLQMIETLIKIARWETGGFRKDVVNCRIKGDNGHAMGTFQVHPINDVEQVDLCSSDITKQAKVAISHVNNSINTCKQFGLKGSNLLTVYTHGKCHAANDGVARMRWGDGKAIQIIIDSEPERHLEVKP